MDPLASLFARFAARGDVDALGEVFDRTAPRLLHLAMHLAHSAEDAEDLLQATFVLAMKKANTFATDQPLLPWLAGLLAGEARNLARKNTRRRTEPLPDLADAGADGGPIASAERGELVARLRAHVEDLPQEQRQALLLQLQHGLSPTDIAEVLEVPPGTVRMRLHRGLAALRRLLPSALAVWLFGALGTRGLAAVRTAVLSEANTVARAASVSGTAAIAAGVLSMKYVLAGVAVVLAALMCWWLAQPATIAPSAGASHDAAVASASVGSDAAALSAVERIAANEAASPLPDGTGSLRVQVTSAGSGRPLPDLSLRLWPGNEKRSVDGTERLLRTDADGVVRVLALAPGQWQVDAIVSNATTSTATVVAGTETTHAITLAARPVHGIVVDENDVPIPGASIRVSKSNSTSGWGVDRLRPAVPTSAFTRTAAISAPDGTFACDANDEEPYVAATHPQFESSCSQLTTAGLARWRFVLQRRSRELRGIVCDANRQPIAGANVQARAFAVPERTRDGTWLGPLLLEFATTGADGRFAFDALPPGSAWLEARASGRNSGRAGTQKQVDDVEIVLTDAIEVVGTVREADGTPFRSGYVYVRGGPDRAAGGEAFVHNGNFLVRELPRPPFTIALLGDRGRVTVLEQEVARCEGTVVHVDLVVPARPALRGAVIDDGGRPLAGWTVTAYWPDAPGGERLVQQTATDDDGRFVLSNLRGDRLRITAVWEGGNLSTPATTRDDVSPFAGELELRVPADRLPRGGVAGRVIDGAGQAIATAMLSLRRYSNARHTAPSGGDGAFRIEHVPSGDYELLFAARDAPLRTLRSVRIADDAPVELGDVRVQPLATLCVDVVHHDGTPWHQMLPDVWLQEPDGSHRDWLPKTENGSCEGKVEPGRVRVLAQGVDLIAQPQDLELLPGEMRSIRVVVDIGRSTALVFGGERDANIDPKDVLRLVVTDERGAVVHRDEVRRSPHGDGNWQLDHVFAFGSYEVTARTDSDRRYRMKFVVDDARSSSRRIEVPRLP